jgi:CRISPR-associated endonuclease Csn1
MRILGLDIGIASVGYATVDMEGATIERVGVRLFDKAEEPKTGAPLAGPRRDARHARRTIRRRAGRMKAIRRLFELDALPHYSADITDETLKAMSQQSQEATPWELRADGLKRLLSKQELARVLYHIAKHRGFQSTKKGEAKEAGSEAGKMLSKASEIKSALEASGHKTIGAYFYYEKLLKGQRVRNGTDNYSNTILRQLHRDEIDALVKAQQGYGATWLSEAWVEKYKHMAFHQAPLKSVEGMVGKCSLLPDQPRAPRAPRMSRSAELFVLWQNINHLRLSGPRGLERGLEADEREFLFNAAHDLKQLTYEQIRQKLKIEPDWRFKNLFYRQPKKKTKSDDAPVAEQDIVKVTEKKKFIALDGYHTLKTILGEQPSGEQVHVWDEVARILSFEQSEDAIRDELWKWNQAHQTPLTQDQIERLAKIDNFKGTVHHSAEAIQRLLPFLEAGETYDKAVVLGQLYLTRL